MAKIRYGEARKGFPPERRSVLTVFDWTPERISDSLAHGQPYLDDGIDLLPSERGALVDVRTLLRRFRRYCNDLKRSAGLDLHSFRRSYSTHLIGDGWDAKFVQDEADHEYASTTSLCTGVSSVFSHAAPRPRPYQRHAYQLYAYLSAVLDNYLRHYSYHHTDNQQSS